MKQTLRPALASSIALALLSFSTTTLNAQCPQVEAIMVNACGPESVNEFIIIHSGAGFNTADIQLDYDASNNNLGPVNNDINIDMDNWPANPTPCGLTTGNISAFTGCPNLIAVGPGVNIPANAIVVLQTSAGSTPGLYNFAALCGSGQCVYVISSACARSAGAFTNQGAGTRTTNFSIAGGCTQSITYDLAALTNTNGDYYLPLSGAYGNSGCAVPPTSPAPLPPMITPIANVTVCGSYTLPPIAGTNLTPNAAYFTGPNGTGTQYAPGDVITSTTTLYAFDQNGPSCSDQEQFTVTISPAPTVNLPNDATPCANQMVSIPLTGTPGATFPWTNSNTAIGLGASGTGNISFTAANVSTQQVATITITPTLGGCPGTPVSFTITVTPVPAVDDPANQSACAGTTVTTTFSSPSGNPTYAWTNNNTAIGLGASGSGNISFTAANVTNPVTATITVTPTENGCAGTPQTFTITINPAATVNQPANVSGCAGQPATVNFSGSSGATFAWTNNNTAIGLGASGNGNISFNIANVTMQEVGTITVTPTSPAGCPGTPVTFTITANPGPTMNDPMDVTACANTSASVAFSSPAGNPTYAWTNSNTAIGLGASGNGNISFTTANVSTPTTATITVTPSLAGCIGTPQTFTITVTPGPTMNDPANQSVCIGDVVNDTFSSASGNPTYAWTNNNTAIGLGASGSGNISFTAANVTNPTTATITVTPTENNCPGTPQTFTITVNPAPTVNQPANISGCAGQPASVNFSGSTGATFAWTNSNTAIGLGASGSGNISFTIANVTMQEVGTITVTPTSPAGCPGTPVTFTITANPGPTMNDPMDVSACANTATSVAFSSPAGNPTYAWTNSNTAIGLGASGSGNISFTTANVSAPTTATITVTPSLGGCIGTPQTFTITVHPTPQVNDPANQSVCIGDVVTTTFSSPSGNPTYTWTNSNTAIGLGASGSGNISFTAANVTNPTTGTITVTPTENNCPGTPQTFTITVNPAPTVNQPANVSGCAGQPATVNFSGSSGATFAWTNSNTAIGLGASGSGNISFNIANVTMQVVGTITVTPTSPAGCPGTPVTFTITANPGPTVNDPANQTVCAGDAVTTTFSSPSGSPTYNWTNSNPGIGLAASGTGNISFTAANVSNPVTATVTVTPTENGCTGTAQTFTITVNPAATVTQPANTSGCAGQPVTVNFSGSSGATFAWTNSNTAIGLGASGSGNISFTVANVTMQEVGTITVTPTSPAGCPGTPVTFTITADPGPTMDDPMDQIACGNSPLSVVFTSPAGAPTYTWINSNTAIGLGASGSGNLNFTTANVTVPVTATITVTPALGGCSGTPQTFTITVNPTPQVNDPANQSVCAGDAVTVTFTSPSGNPTYAWSNSNTAIGLDASGAGNISFTAANVPSTQTGTITVTPTENGCPGPAQMFTITVAPSPVVNPPGNVNACSGQTVGINFTGTAGAAFSWTNNNTAIGLVASGTGNISFPAANVQNPETATITVTPTLGPCMGMPITFTITINPGPTVDDPANQTVCGNDPVSVPFTSPSGNPNFNWTNNNPAIGLPASGSGNINFTAVNPAFTQTAIITVTPSANGCVGPSQTFTVTVNPLPTVTAPANQSACSGQIVVTNFSGTPGATFSWTNSNPAIGLPAAGSGNINFTAANVQNQEVATITITPVLGPCTGAPVTFTITVNPGPTMDPVADELVCGGTPISVFFSSPSGNPTYSWTNSNTAIGLGATGFGNINFTAANPAATQTATITVTPALGGCIGTPETFTISVSPIPAMGQPAPAIACGGSTITINFAGSAGADFEWTNSNPNIGLPGAGSGNISFATANPATQQVGTITVTPVIGGCEGPARTFTITVNPAPAMNPPVNQAVCSGDMVNVVFSSPVGTPAFTWSNNNTAIGLAAAGVGNISYTSPMVATAQTATITVTPSANGCTGPAQTFTIIVSPTPTATQPANVSFCGGQPATIALSGSPGATLNWTNNNPATGIPSSGSGPNIIFNAANVPIQQVSTVIITPTVGSCSGTPVLFTVTVNPAPTVAQPANRKACAGEQVTLNFAPSPGATVSWTNSNTNIGLPAAGTGNLNFTTAQVTGPETAVITVTPEIGGGGACPGLPVTFEITVNPGLSVDDPGDRFACVGDLLEVLFSGGGAPNVSWTNDNPAIGLPATGTGNISFTAANVPGVETATITVTPQAAGAYAYITNNITNDVSVIDLTTNTIVTTIPVGFAPYGVSVSPDGSRVYVTNQTSPNGTVSVIDAGTNTVVATIPAGIGPAGVCFSPDGSRAYVANTGSATVSVVNTATNTVVATIPVAAQPRGVASTPDGSRVYVASSTPGRVTVITTATNTVLATITGAGNGLQGVLVHPDGSRAYVSSGNSDHLAVVDVATNTILTTIPVGDAPNGLVFSPDGSRIYVANENEATVSVVDVATNTVLTTIQLSNAPLSGPIGISITPNGQFVYVANVLSDEVSVVNTSTNTEIGTIPVGTAPVAFGNFITPLTACPGTPQTFTITVGPAPALAQPNNLSGCANTTNTLIFNTSAGAMVNWINNNPAIGLPASGTGDLNFTAANVATTQTATITATPVLGSCSGAPVTFTVTVHPAAMGSISGDLLVCAGDSTTLTASGGTAYEWDNGATTASITVSPGVPTTYVATISTAAGCSTTASVFVNVGPGPAAAISGDTALCSGETTTLTASGGSVYLWSSGEATANITVSAALAGTFTVNVTDLFGCTATASATVVLLPSDATFIARTTCNPADSGTVVQVLQNQFGCDSTITTATTLLPSNSLTFTQFTCDPGAAGVFTQNLVNQFGCDSTVVTTVLFDPAAIDSTVLSATTCDPAQAGVVVQNLTNLFGCDSIVVTTTTLLPTDNVAFTQFSCNPGAAGVFTQNLVNQFGCDSTVVTTVLFDPAAGDSTLLNATTCDPAQVGVSVQNLTNLFGCDSIVTTTTTLLPSNAVSVFATTCDPAQAGVTVQNLTNQFGCDSIVTTTTTLLPSDAVSVFATTCDPAQAGVSVQNLTNQFGCDSIVTTTTTLLPSDAVSLSATTCDPAQAGVSVQNLNNQFGCDSIVTTTTTLLPSDAVSVSATTCNPAQAGVVVQNLTNQFGCDSIVTTTTTLLPSNTVNLSATTCDPAQAGVSVQNLTNQFGCDSIVTTTTTLLPSDAVNVSATTCDPAQVGVSVQNLTNQFGCDSIVTTTTTLLPSDAVSVSATTCDPAQAGVSVQNLTNQFGCDSIVTTTTVLDLNACGPVVAVSAINPTCANSTTGSFAIQVLNGLLPMQYNWVSSTGNTGAGQITSLTPPTVVSNLPAGTYSITITDASNATSTASATLTAPPILSATASAPAPYNGYEIRCNGASDGSATASAAGGTPPYQLSWNTGGTGPALSNLSAGIYTVTATDANGCTALGSATLTAPPPLAFSLELDRADCGDTLVDATVTAAGGVAPYTISVDGNIVAGTMPSLGAGAHLVAVTDGNGCTADSTVSISLPPLPAISMPPDTSVVLGNTLRIEAVTNLTAWSSLTWQPLPDTTCPACLVQEWTPAGFQLITVTITDTFGCKATARIRVSVDKKLELYVPNAFYPNRDGGNDIWTINAGTSVTELREVTVFDRWGNLQYRWDTPLPPNTWPGWDGTTRGQKAGPGVYVFYMKVLLADGTEQVVKGDVTLFD